MKCPNCANVIQENAVVCQHCGQAIKTPNVIGNTPGSDSHSERKYFKKDIGLGINIVFISPEKIYYPGDVLQLSVEIYCEKRIKTNEIRANIEWNETYYLDDGFPPSMILDNSRYVTNSKTLSSKVLIEKGEIPAGFGQVYKIDLPIPADAPPGYTGKFLDSYLTITLTGHPFGDDLTSDNIKYLIHTSGPGSNESPSKRENQRILQFHAHRLIQSPEIKIVVPPPGINIDPIEHMEANKKYEMRLRLPRSEWSEGEIIQGQLLVRGLDRYINPQSIDVCFLWKETTGKLTFDSIGIIKLAEKAAFPFEKTVEYNFELEVPVLNRPTLKTDRTSVEWSVVASIGTGIFRPQCAQVISVYTSVGQNKPKSQIDFAAPGLPIAVVDGESVPVQKTLQPDENFASDSVVQEQQKRIALQRLRTLYNDIARAKEKANPWSLPLLLGMGGGSLSCCISFSLLSTWEQASSGSAEEFPIATAVGFGLFISSWILITFLVRRKMKSNSKNKISKAENELKVAIDGIAEQYSNWINEIGGKTSLQDESIVEKLLMNIGAKQL